VAARRVGAVEPRLLRVLACGEAPSSGCQAAMVRDEAVGPPRVALVWPRQGREASRHRRVVVPHAAGEDARAWCSEQVEVAAPPVA